MVDKKNYSLNYITKTLFATFRNIKIYYRLYVISIKLGVKGDHILTTLDCVALFILEKNSSPPFSDV